MTDEILKDGVLAAAMGTTVVGMTGTAALAAGEVEVTTIQVTTEMFHVGGITKRMTRILVVAATRDRAAGMVQPEQRIPYVRCRNALPRLAPR